jgi:hypothetical protein
MFGTKLGPDLPLSRVAVVLLAAANGFTWSCARMAASAQSTADVDEGLLSNVILLPLATRSTEDLLGHAWDAETDLADPLRAVLTGTVAVSNTDQHVVFLRELTHRAQLDADLALANAGVWASRVTHVAYDVNVTALASFASGTQKYNAESGCCQQGVPAASCELGYVYRLLRGSGSIRMLQRLPGQVSVGSKDVIFARGGASYRVVDQSAFTDAYFGLELTPLHSVCRTLTPEVEMSPMHLSAPPNCVVHRYGALGEAESLSRHVPTEQLCETVAQRYCSEWSGMISCRVRFGTADETKENDLATSIAEPWSQASVPASSTQDHASNGAPSGASTVVPK